MVMLDTVPVGFDAGIRTLVAGAVKENCVSIARLSMLRTSAASSITKTGHVYRWDLVTNSLSSPFPMAPATGEAYTATIIGADGKVFAINNATLFAVGDNRQNSVSDVSGQVSVTRSPFLVQRSSGQYYQTITVTNNTNATIDGPFSLILDNLTNGTLTNATGTTSALTPVVGHIFARLSEVLGQERTHNSRSSSPRPARQSRIQRRCGRVRERDES